MDKGMWRQFQIVNKFLMKVRVLNIADPNESFVVSTNSYNRGHGGSLMQNGQVVGYESWKPNEHEQNYSTHDLELAAIIRALDMWRHYLLRMMFILMSDHTGLRYLFDQSNLNAK